MNQIELERKTDNETINGIAEKPELVFYANIKIKEELLQQVIAKDVRKNKMIDAGQMFIEYEKELDESNQIIKS